MRSKSDPRRDVHAHLVQHVRRKSDRVKTLRNRRPHIEGRARRRDLPAQRVECVGNEAVTAGVDLTRGTRLLFPTVQRLDASPLDSLEDARVDVRLQLSDQRDQVGPAANPTQSPARHVEGLRQRVKLESYLLGAWTLEQAQRPV